MVSRTPRPTASSENARLTMRANRATSAREIAFRRAVWEAGVRGYRTHPRLSGRPDIYFSRLRLAVFVHGCFWHRCAVCVPPQPRANAEFWRQKFEANLERDERVKLELTLAGIEVMTIWEHEIRPDPTRRAQAFADEIRARRARMAGTTHPPAAT